MKVDKVNQFANGTRSKGHSAQGPRLNWLFYLPAPASRELLCWLSKCLKYLGCLLLVLFRPVRPAAPHPSSPFPAAPTRSRSWSFAPKIIKMSGINYEQTSRPCTQDYRTRKSRWHIILGDWERKWVDCLMSEWLTAWQFSHPVCGCVWVNGFLGGPDHFKYWQRWTAWRIRNVGCGLCGS